MTEQEFIAFQIWLFAIKDTKTMEEDFSNVFNNKLHVIKDTKIMAYKLFVFTAAKLAIQDLKIMAPELNVFLSTKHVLQDTKMMED